MRRKLLVALAAVVTLAACGGGPVETSAPVTVDGDALVESTGNPFDDAAVGTPVPVVSGSDLRSGAPVTFGDGGDATVVVFAAHWCPHCNEELPEIADYLDANGLPEDVTIVGVSSSSQPGAPGWPPAEWVESKVGWPTDVPMLDDGDNAAFIAYGMTGFPAFAAVGEDGNLVARASGQIGVDGFAAMVDAARAGSLTPAG